MHLETPSADSILLGGRDYAGERDIFATGSFNDGFLLWARNDRREAVTELEIRMIEARCLIIRSKLCTITVMRNKTGMELSV